ncbi:MAG: hypothetical protein CMJ28_07215 [Phycisphaerae bacterium]|nr:hypothetical protein [Phycisphaerae bacterium]
MRNTLVGAFLLFLSTSLHGQNIPFQHDGLNRQYRIHIPNGIKDNAPLVLALHGYSGNNNDMISNYGWVELANEQGFAIACPNGTFDQSGNRFWDVDYDFHPQFDIDDDGFVVALAEHLQSLHGFDPDRTFVTGFSNGAEMCFQLACRESESFAAFAPIVGMMLDPLFQECAPTSPKPMLSLNGTSDNVTLYNGDLNNTGGWGPYHSIPDTMELWRTILGTTESESVNLPNIDPNDGSIVRLETNRSLETEQLLNYYLVIGGGHDWPGQSGNRDISATLEVWKFFNDVTSGPCLQSDVNEDNTINNMDILTVLSGWGSPYGISDLIGVLSSWGEVCEPQGACCSSNGACSLVTSVECANLGGNWFSEETSCTFPGCPPFGVCCVEGTVCEELLESECSNIGGSFRGDQTECSNIDCTQNFNDECVDAISVANGEVAFSTTEASSSNDGYNDSLCPNTYLGEMFSDIWFSYEAVCTGTLRLSTCNSASFDTDLVVYEGNCLNKVQIGCNGDNDDCDDFTSELTCAVQQGQQYLIRVGGWENGNSGSGILLIECE